MLITILLLLIVLWFLGVNPIAALDFPLFTFGGQTIDLWDLILFGVILWLIGILPSPFRQIAGVAFVLWLLALFGIIAIAGLSNIIVLAMIVGLILYIVGVR
jgi:hypothetical protein